jgi:hypothetical protein
LLFGFVVHGEITTRPRGSSAVPDVCNGSKASPRGDGRWKRGSSTHGPITEAVISETSLLRPPHQRCLDRRMELPSLPARLCGDMQCVFVAFWPLCAAL